MFLNVDCFCWSRPQPDRQFADDVCYLTLLKRQVGLTNAPTLTCPSPLPRAALESLQQTHYHKFIQKTRKIQRPHLLHHQQNGAKEDIRSAEKYPARDRPYGLRENVNILSRICPRRRRCHFRDSTIHKLESSPQKPPKKTPATPLDNHPKIAKMTHLAQKWQCHIADVAELADAQASGACGGNPVEVRVLSSAGPF